MIVREFLTRLGFEADDRKVKRFDGVVKGLTAGLVAGVAAATAMQAAAFKLARETAQYGDELAKTADRLGVNIDALEQLRFAAERSGVGQATLEMSLQRMTRRLAEAAKGSGEAKGALAQLGLSAKSLAAQEPDKAMEAIADALAGVEDQSEKVRLAFKFFDSEGVALLNLLGNGAGDVRALREEFELLSGGLTKEDARAAEVFSDRLTDLQTVVQGLRLQIGARLMPVIQPMIEAFTEFLVTNREIISQRVAQAFETISNAISNLTALGKGVAGLFWPIVEVFQAMGPAGILAGIGMAALVLPLRRFKGILVALGATTILEDLGSWMQGQPSLIQSMLGPYKDFAEAVEKWTESLGGLNNIIGALVVLSFAKWLSGVAGGLNKLTPALNKLGGNGPKKGLGVLTALGSRGGLVGAIVAAFGLAYVFKDEIDPADELIGETTGSPLRGGNTEPLNLGGDEQSTNSGDKKGFWSGLLDYLGDGNGLNDLNGANAGDIGLQPITNNEINMDFKMNITTPPGTTAEQVSFIERSVRKTMTREINRAVLDLEA